MGTFRVIDPSIKATAIDDVRNNGMPVSQVAKKHGVDPRTIYGWLKKEVGNSDRNLILEKVLYKSTV